MKQININLLGPEAAGGGLALPAGFSLDFVLIGIVAGGLVVALSLPAVTTWAIDTFLSNPADAQIAQLKEQIGKNKKGSQDLKTLQAEVNAREQDLRELQGLVGQGGMWASMLEELRNLTPTDLWLTSLHSDSDHIEVEGSALEYKDVAYFYTNLQNSHNFAGPVLGNISMQGGGGGGSQPVIHFTLRASIIRPGGQ